MGFFSRLFSTKAKLREDPAKKQIGDALFRGGDKRENHMDAIIGVANNMQLHTIAMLSHYVNNFSYEGGHDLRIFSLFLSCMYSPMTLTNVLVRESWLAPYTKTDVARAIKTLLRTQIERFLGKKSLDKLT